jgi:hypothetical protein
LSNILKEDLDRYHGELLQTLKDPYLSRVDRTLVSYHDGLPRFIAAARGEASTLHSDPKLTSERMNRDWSNIDIYVAKAMSHSAPSARNLFLAAAFLVRFNVIDLTGVVAHLPEDPHFPFRVVLKPPICEPPPVPEDATSELFDPSPNWCNIEDEDPAIMKKKAASAATGAQVAALITALFAIGDVNGAFKVISVYQDVDWCLVSPPIACQALRLVSWILGSNSDIHTSNLEADPIVYTKAFPGKQRFFFPHWTDMLARNDIVMVSNLLRIVGHAVCLRPNVVSQILDYLLNVSCATAGPESEFSSPTSMLVEYILPAVSLCSGCPPSLVLSVWELIRQWPATKRFALYHHWETKVYTKTTILMARRLDNITRATRYWMKRISKEVVPTYRRKIPKLVLGNPVPVLSHLVSTVMNYDNLGQSVLKCLEWVDPLSMDVLMYTFLTSLGDRVKSCAQRSTLTSLISKDSCLGVGLKDDGLNLESWIINTSNFMSSWLAQYPQTDFLPLLAYLDRVTTIECNEMETGHSNTVKYASAFGLGDAKILSDLVANMAGIPVIENVPLHTINALESRTCVARRVLIAAISEMAISAAATPSSPSGSNPPNLIAIHAASSCALVTQLADSGLLLRFVQHLRQLVSKLAEKSRAAWKDLDFVERVSSSDLQAELQWRDRVRAIETQYRNFIRLYAPDIELDEATWELVPAALYNDSTERCALFWELRYYHIHYDPSMYLSSEESDREKHFADYTSAVARVTQLCGDTSNTVKCEESITNTEDLLETVDMDVEHVVSTVDSGGQEDLESTGIVSTLASPSNSLPKAADLARRACQSAADALYSCFWADRVSHSELSRVVDSVWCVRGLTESETNHFGVLISRCLKVLHRNASVSPNSSDSEKQVAELVRNCHISLVAFCKMALDENSDLYLVRNALTLLKSVSAEFPIAREHAAILCESIKKVQNDSLKVMTRVVEGSVRKVANKEDPRESRFYPPAPPKKEAKAKLESGASVHLSDKPPTIAEISERTPEKLISDVNYTETLLDPGATTEGSSKTEDAIPILTALTIELPEGSINNSSGSNSVEASIPSSNDAVHLLKNNTEPPRLPRKPSSFDKIDEKVKSSEPAHFPSPLVNAKNVPLRRDNASIPQGVTPRGTSSTVSNAVSLDPVITENELHPGQREGSNLSVAQNPSEIPRIRVREPAADGESGKSKLESVHYDKVRESAVASRENQKYRGNASEKDERDRQFETKPQLEKRIERNKESNPVPRNEMRVKTSISEEPRPGARVEERAESKSIESSTQRRSSLDIRKEVRGNPRDGLISPSHAQRIGIPQVQRASLGDRKSAPPNEYPPPKGGISTERFSEPSRANNFSSSHPPQSKKLESEPFEDFVASQPPSKRQKISPSPENRQVAVDHHPAYRKDVPVQSIPANIMRGSSAAHHNPISRNPSLNSVQLDPSLSARLSSRPPLSRASTLSEVDIVPPSNHQPLPRRDGPPPPPPPAPSPRPPIPYPYNASSGGHRHPPSGGYRRHDNHGGSNYRR